MGEYYTMPKLAIIINGKPGSGKDALCDAVILRGRAGKVSSIEPIVEIAKLGGWDGVKDAKSRKLLSDLKSLFAEFNGLPTRYLLEKYQEFSSGLDEVLFVHIRECGQIDAFIRGISGPAVTLLVRRPGIGETGNRSDDETDNYTYDVIFDNDLPLEESERAFCALVDGIREKYE
jgi:hypothetical protein